jgi:hypothetical protein
MLGVVAALGAGAPPAAAERAPVESTVAVRPDRAEPGAIGQERSDRPRLVVVVRVPGGDPAATAAAALKALREGRSRISAAEAGAPVTPPPPARVAFDAPSPVTVHTSTRAS